MEKLIKFMRVVLAIGWFVVTLPKRLRQAGAIYGHFI
jgi:hypothetical protein